MLTCVLFTYLLTREYVRGTRSPCSQVSCMTCEKLCPAAAAAVSACNEKRSLGEIALKLIAAVNHVTWWFIADDVWVDCFRFCICQADAGVCAEARRLHRALCIFICMYRKVWTSRSRVANVKGQVAKYVWWNVNGRRKERLMRRDSSSMEKRKAGTHYVTITNTVV